MERGFKSGRGPIYDKLKTMSAALKGLECYPVHLEGKQAKSAIIIEEHRNGNACTDALELHKKLYSQTQFIGFELSHTGARTRFDIQKDIYDGNQASVGVAYSLRHAAQLGGFTYFQDTRFHKLTHLDWKFRICLQGYLDAKPRFPEQLVIYRIGSDEGDYKQVRQELEEVRAACLKFKAEYTPKFVVTLVQRRSRIRVSPERIEGTKAVEQNVPSGTCVDTVGNIEPSAQLATPS